MSDNLAFTALHPLNEYPDYLAINIMNFIYFAMNT